jgi:hypothetical protein
MSYTPPDAHNVILDFEQPITPLDSHNLVLNFGDVEPQLSVLNAVIDTRIQAFIQGSNTEIVINHGDLLATINTNIQAEINGTNWENVDNRGTLLVVVDTSIQARVSGINHINHIRGIEAYWIAEYQRAKPCLIAPEIQWAKPIFKAHKSAFYFERSLTFGNQVFVGFDKANTLHRAVQIIHEQTTGLSRSAYLKWQENEKLFISRSLVFDESNKLTINQNMDWVELVRKRKTFTYSHQVAHVFEKHFTFDWDKGLEFITTSNIAWDKAKSIHYRKHEIQPWPKPELPEYIGSTDLNFVCLCHDVDPHNVVLNFGADDCIPALPNINGWYILNSLSVNRLDNGEKINVLDGNYSTDRSRWCWSYGLTVPASEITKLEPISGQPVILKIMVNGFEHHMMLENRSRSRRFAQETYSLSGRSQTALLDALYAPTRSF